ncbi:MAG: hypothetical protein IBX56_15185 [Methylomicrobium sp.]|nr:hypothetical protein [Methylomicrobium sp.]
MSCCDDPTEIHKVDPRELVREQQHYGNLVRDLFTDDPEKVLLKLLNESNAYLKELAALRAHYPSVRLRAIELLDKKSQAVLEQLIEQEPDSSFGIAAKQRIEQLSNETGLFGKLFKS